MMGLWYADGVYGGIPPVEVGFGFAMMRNKIKASH